MLSDNSKRIRNRATAINMHITFTTWFIELIGNATILIVRLLSTKTKILEFIIIKLYWFNSLILIPSLYVCNTEKVKDYLKTIDWYNTLLDKLRSNKIQPSQAQNIKMHCISNDSVQNCSNKTDKISSVQGNLNRLSKSNSESNISCRIKDEKRKNSI